MFSCCFNQQGLDFLSFSVRGFDERTGIKRISQRVMIMLLASEPKPLLKAFPSTSVGCDQPYALPQDRAGFALNTFSELDKRVSKGLHVVRSQKSANRQGDKGEERKIFPPPSTSLNIFLTVSPIIFLFQVFPNIS